MWHWDKGGYDYGIVLLPLHRDQLDIASFPSGLQLYPRIFIIPRISDERGIILLFGLPDLPDRLDKDGSDVLLSLSVGSLSGEELFLVHHLVGTA